MIFFPYLVSSSAERKTVPKGGKFNTKTQKQKKEAQNTSKINPWGVTIGLQEVHPRIRAEDNDGQPGLQVVSECSRWMRVCPMVGFTPVKRVLELLTAAHQNVCVQR